MAVEEKSVARGKANGAGRAGSAADTEGAEKQVTDQAKPDHAAGVSPEMQAKLSELRERIQLSVGQAVLAMMNLPRYKGQALGDLPHLVIEPLLRDRVAIAYAGKKDGDDGAAATAGIAIWASVSDDVDAKITEQIKGGAFPTRLGPDDWTSGEKIWLLDLIALNRKLATAVLANFKQIAGDKPVSIHPIVARSVDPEVLERMRVKPE